MKTKCELCGIEQKLTRHHLIPQVKNKFNLKQKLKEQNIDIEQTINICSLCHTTIHALFTENQLRDELNTKEKLLDNQEFLKYINWRIKHPNFKSNSTKLKRK